MTVDIVDENSAIQPISALATKLKNHLSSVVYGQDEAILMLTIGLLAEGHMLLEGLPGMAKTTLVKAFSSLIQLEFKRIQLTPDLLPAEITGTSIYDLNTKQFLFKKGPIFTEILLADEINRTPPKTQSALLEAMEEHQVTTDGITQALSPFFTVIATLNPIEFEGTFPLPEAQLDRFMLKVEMGYPTLAAEKQMLQQAAQANQSAKLQLTPITSKAELAQCRQLLNQIVISGPVMDYILTIVQQTRTNTNLAIGASPRSALALMNASRAHAGIHNQSYVSPDNVKAVAYNVLGHRLLLNTEAELENLSPRQVLQQILHQVPVPR